MSDKPKIVSTEKPPKWAMNVAEHVFTRAIEWNEGRKPWNIEDVAWIIARHTPSRELL